MVTRELSPEERKKADRLQIAATVLAWLLVVLSALLLFVGYSVWQPAAGIPAGFLLWQVGGGVGFRSVLRLSNSKLVRGVW